MIYDDMFKGMKIIFIEKNKNIVIGGGEKDFKLCIIEYSKYIYIEIIVI